jgi:hypothetical protein
MRLLPVALALSFLTAVSLPAAQSGTASGALTIDGKKYELKYAQAKTQPNAFDEKKTDTVVLLTDAPVEESVFASDRKLFEAGKNEKFHGLIVTLESGTTPYHLSVVAGKVQYQISGNVFDFKPSKGAGVGGRLFTTETGTIGDAKYSYDVTFRADVKALKDDKPPEPPVINASNGKKLPSGGGEPGAAFMRFDKAMRSADFKTLEKMQSKASIDAGMGLPTDPKERQAMVEFIKVMHPAKLTIVDGYANADHATLLVTGDDPFQPGKQTNGTISMTHESDGWKIDKESWKN